MLRCKNLTLRASGNGPEILSGANAVFRPRALNAVIGPSGCGKTTLVKSMLRLLPATGESYLDGRLLTSPDDLAGRVGFAQQFTNAHPQLTVEETFQVALDLTVADTEEKQRRMASVLETTGLGAHREKRVSALSGGQLRRLGLGMELTLDPACMVCDEVTSGLDPHSEAQILDLLRKLVEEREKAFICIIHNLAKLDAFDWITVVHQGVVIFQGELPVLLEYFGIPDALRLYEVMHAQPLGYWKECWQQFLENNPGYYFWQPAGTDTPAPATGALSPIAEAPPQGAHRPTTAQVRPNVVSQFITLFKRRMLLFSRDTGYLGLTMAITFGFPVIVVIFALTGLPDVPAQALERIGTSMDEIMSAMNIQKERFRIGSLASVLIMFQVILLTLMGANNGGREIAAERSLYEKERLTGLNPAAYVLAKLLFVTLIACFQGLWMAVFVKTICQFPGPWSLQVLTMMAVCASMSIVCLAFSAIMQSAEKASLLSIYLVGFQIPLSGVVLALPAALVWVCRPFINAYWGWAGYMHSMQNERIYDAYTSANLQMEIATPSMANGVLFAQAALGLTIIFVGCFRRRPL
ncbi:MAG: ABC transporter ATP-binding protein/permease [Puniceicoccales bacterium]|jgi:ABC-type multidrug transport system ATPase subunit|nr:ABC transporter ATP-binding protein/permease [Puniceicoccales bacterium]